MITSQSPSFYGRTVTRSGDYLPWTLTVYLDEKHAFIRLEDKARNIDAPVGLYPPENYVTTKLGSIHKPDCHYEDAIQYEPDYCDIPYAPPRAAQPDPMCAVPREAASDQCAAPDLVCSENTKVLDKLDNLIRGSLFADIAGIASTIGVAAPTGTSLGVVSSTPSVGALYLLMKEFPGVVKEETVSYAPYNGFIGIPKVTFDISDTEAVRVANFIIDYEDACSNKTRECIYHTTRFNCLDFANTALAKTAYPGHFIEYFSPVQLTQKFGIATAYASLSHPSIQALSLTGSTMLAVSLLQKMPSVAGYLKDRFVSYFWPEEAVSEQNFQDLFKSVESYFYAYENFWGEFTERNETTKRFLDKCIDLQFRFVELEKAINTAKDKDRNLLYQKLESLKKSYRMFTRALERKLGTRLITDAISQSCAQKPIVEQTASERHRP